MVIKCHTRIVQNCLGPPRSERQIRPCFPKWLNFGSYFSRDHRAQNRQRWLCWPSPATYMERLTRFAIRWHWVKREAIARTIFWNLRMLKAPNLWWAGITKEEVMSPSNLRLIHIETTDTGSSSKSKSYSSALKTVYANWGAFFEHNAKPTKAQVESKNLRLRACFLDCWKSLR